mgnify:FL=1
MKKTLSIFIIISILLGSNSTCLSQDYYSGKTSIKGNCYEFKVTRLTNYFIVGNIKNSKFRTSQFLPNGDPAPITQLHLTAHYVDTNQVVNAFKTVFTNEEISLFNSDKSLLLSIAFIISTKGDVLETEFDFIDHPVMKSIHPDKLYSFEKEIKKTVKFWVEERTKILDYIQGRTYTLNLSYLRSKL